MTDVRGLVNVRTKYVAGFNWLTESLTSYSQILLCITTTTSSSIFNRKNLFVHPSSSSTLSLDLLYYTLLRLKHNSKIALALFHYANSLPSPPLSPDAFHVLIDTVAKARQYDVAWQLILQMDHPSPAAFLILVCRLISSSLTCQAVRAFDDIETFIQAQLTSKHFVFLLDTLSKYGYIKLETKVFNRRKHEFVVDVKMYTVIVYGWCKIGRFDMAERFLREMIERSIEPNVVNYNVFFDGICRRASLHPEDRFRRTIMNAQKVFDEMSSRGIEPRFLLMKKLNPTAVTSMAVLGKVFFTKLQTDVHFPATSRPNLVKLSSRNI